MKSFKATSDELTREAIESEVPVRFVHNGVMINQDGSLALAIKVQYPYLTTYNSERKEGLFQSLRSLYETLPEHYRIQFIFGQHSSPSQIQELKKPFEKRGTIIHEARADHFESLEKQLKMGNLRYFEGLVCLVRDPIISIDRARSRMWSDFKESAEGKKAGVLSKLRKKLALYLFTDEVAYNYTKTEWDDALKDLCSTGDTFLESLHDMDLRPVFLTDPELAEYYYRFWNPQTCNLGGKPIPISAIQRPFTDYFLRGDVDFQPDDVPKGHGIFKMDNAFHQILTLRIPGEFLSFCQWEDVLYYSGINNIRVIVNSRLGSIPKRIDKLKTTRAQMKERVEKDVELAPALREIEDEIQELGENSAKIWEVTFIVHVWDTDVDDLLVNTQRLTQRAEANNGMLLTVETDAALEYWRSAQPGWARDVDRFREITLNTKQLVTQLPVCGEHHGMDRNRIGAVMETATGSLHNYCPHDDLIYSNYNSVVIGGTRSGKTFAILSILIQLWELNLRVTAVDIGGSFRGLCNILGGNYIEVDLDSTQMTINPLHLGENTEYTNEDVERVKRILEQMLTDRASSAGLSSEEMAVLEDALFQLFSREDKREAILSDLRDVLNNHGHTGAKLANRLKRYCGNTGKGRLFDGPTKIDTNNRFTVYDLTKAAEDKEITPLMFQILINNVIRSGMEHLSDLKMLVFDECWKFLSQNQGVAEFVEYAFRGLAKFNFASIAITQGVEELASIQNSQAILNNTSQRFIFKQDSPAAAQQAKEILGLNDTETSLIQQLQSSVGHFSQALHIEQLRTGNTRSTVLVNRASALQHAICTTQGRDRAKIKEYLSKGMNLKEAILEFADKYPHGVSQSE
jgi:hypothetical protein